MHVYAQTYTESAKYGLMELMHASCTNNMKYIFASSAHV